ncbi:hypothetical protein KKB10_01470 [Patescibacteria group bacterium]|nr:hypothetical protein [Patescibacteria group bacterium]MBU1075462.1 hypothetical protein [Patescibacteria group bacterium]MBU1952021.1 hypothetical protein [Patescibacteria group bacterium]
MKVTKKSVPSSTPTADHRKFDKLINHTNSMKKKYSSMDEESKKKVLLGIAGAFAVLSSIAAVSTVKKTKKKMKSRKDSKEVK